MILHLSHFNFKAIHLINNHNTFFKLNTLSKFLINPTTTK